MTFTAKAATPLVYADFHYLDRLDLYEVEKPFFCAQDLTAIPGARHSNHVHKVTEKIPVIDIRSCGEKPRLDVHGFELIKFTDNVIPADFEDDVWIKEHYYELMNQVLKNFLGAKEVRCYEHQIRYRHPGFGKPGLRPGGSIGPPLPVVHADVTSACALAQFPRHWTGWTGEDDTSRLQLINVWRPLVDVVSEWPLALCDVRSVDKEADLRPSDLIKANGFIGESFVAHANPKHQWYYASGMTYKEAWILKFFDSDENAASEKNRFIPLSISEQLRPPDEVAKSEPWYVCELVEKATLALD